MDGRLATAVAAVALVVVGCGGSDGDDDDTSAGSGGSRTIEVPGDAATVQEAVDAAEPGDLVLIAPGTYGEAVDVTTDDLTIRGLDRTEVVLDGGFELDNGIRVLGADGVAIENLTVQNYTTNGVYWTGVDGYRGSYLTALRNGEYGIYAFDSRHGLLEHSYAAGSGDGGFYVGQCYPCDAVVTEVVAEHNGIGYSNADAGGNLVVTASTFRNNRVGVLTGSHTYELCYPQRELTLIGNVIHGNNQADTAAVGLAMLAMGNGIVSAGGVRNVIERNLVFDHDRTGIAIILYPEEEPNDDMPTREEWAVTCDIAREQPLAEPLPAVNVWEPFESRVAGNVVRDSGVADIVLASPSPELPTFGNCIEGNTVTRTAPLALAALAPCTGSPTSQDWAAGALDIVAWLDEVDTFPPPVDYQDVVLPDSDLLSMPDAATAPARPARGLPEPIDLAAIAVPADP